MLDSKANWRRYPCTWKWSSEECNNLYCIERVVNNADELKIKIWALQTKKVDWAAQNDFIQDALVYICHFPVVQGHIEGPLFQSMSIFTSVRNYFVQPQENV